MKKHIIGYGFLSIAITAVVIYLYDEKNAETEHYRLFRD